MSDEATPIEQPVEVPALVVVPDEEAPAPVKEKKPKAALRIPVGDGIPNRKLEDLSIAVKAVLDRYAATHTMKTPDDFAYPGFKELYRVLNS